MHKSQLNSFHLSLAQLTQPQMTDFFRYILNIKNRIFVNDFNKKVIVSSIILMTRFFCFLYGKSGFKNT